MIENNLKAYFSITKWELFTFQNRFLLFLRKKMRRQHLWFIVILFWLNSCSDTSNSNEVINTGDQKTARNLDQDSLSALYLTYIKQRGEASLPTEIIQERNKIYPVDQSPLDTSLFVFWVQLRKAVEKKDIFYIMDHLDPNIDNGPDYPSTVAGFVEKWHLKNEVSTQVSDLWLAMDRLLNLGGVLNQRKTKFISPYYTALLPNNAAKDSLGVILGQGVRIRTAPNSESKILMVKSHDIVPVKDPNGPEELIGVESFPWVKIMLRDSTEGFVYGKYLGQPSDVQMTLQKFGQNWRVIALIG